MFLLEFDSFSLYGDHLGAVRQGSLPVTLVNILVHIYHTDE